LLRKASSLVPKRQAEDISRFLLSSNFPYYYASNIHTGALTTEHDSDISASGFFHRFYDNKERHSQALDLVLPLLYGLLDKTNFELVELLRVRASLSFPSNETHNGFPHVDIPNLENYYTAIVYLTESDGETILFNEFYDGEEQTPKVETLSEACRITPEYNSGVVFEGHRFHTGLQPVTSKVRLVLNYNFFAEDKSSK
jgi:hypothetical protein